MFCKTFVWVFWYQVVFKYIINTKKYVLHQVEVKLYFKSRFFIKEINSYGSSYLQKKSVRKMRKEFDYTLHKVSALRIEQIPKKSIIETFDGLNCNLILT